MGINSETIFIKKAEKLKIILLGFLLFKIIHRTYYLYPNRSILISHFIKDSRSMVCNITFWQAL